MISEDPLVSVVVICYNSEAYIIETLNSILKQTYKNIELVISDDCSTDRTTILCESWLSQYSQVFSSIIFIRNEINLGIAGNCNIACKSANGIWIKLIAGDDLLTPDCVFDNVSFVKANTNIEFLQSSNRYIDSESNFIKPDCYVANDRLFFNDRSSAYLQHEILLRKYVANTVSNFISKRALSRVNYFDESIPMLEDYPLYFRITKAGIRIFFMDKITTYYRVHTNSISFGGKSDYGKLLPKIIIQKMLVHKKYIIPELSGLEKFLELYNCLITALFLKKPFNKNRMLNRSVWHILQMPVFLSRRLALKKIYKS